MLQHIHRCDQGYWVWEQCVSLVAGVNTWKSFQFPDVNGHLLTLILNTYSQTWGFWVSWFSSVISKDVILHSSDVNCCFAVTLHIFRRMQKLFITRLNLIYADLFQESVVVCAQPGSSVTTVVSRDGTINSTRRPIWAQPWRLTPSEEPPMLKALCLRKCEYHRTCLNVKGWRWSDGLLQSTASPFNVFVCHRRLWCEEKTRI